MESNTTTSKSEEKWDAEAFFAAKEEELARTTTTSNQIDYEKYLIFNLSCSNHMTSNKEKLQNLLEYKGSCVVVTTNSSKLLVTHISYTINVPL